MSSKKIKELLVNNRYQIIFIGKTYVVYDTLEAKDIPQYVFNLAETIAELNKKRKEIGKEYDKNNLSSL